MIKTLFLLTFLAFPAKNIDLYPRLVMTNWSKHWDRNMIRQEEDSRRNAIQLASDTCQIGGGLLMIVEDENVEYQIWKRELRGFVEYKTKAKILYKCVFTEQQPQDKM